MWKSSFIGLSSAALLGAVAVGATLGSASPARADDMTTVWAKYQEAVRVAELCRDMRHDAAAWSKMGPFIDSKVNHEISAGERLTLIEEAKTDARKVAKLKGCDSEEAKSYLTVYDTELAPLVK